MLKIFKCEIDVKAIVSAINSLAEPMNKTEFSPSDIFRITLSLFEDGIEGGLLRSWFLKDVFQTELKKSSHGVARKFPIKAIYEAAIIKSMTMMGASFKQIIPVLKEIAASEYKNLGVIKWDSTNALPHYFPREMTLQEYLSQKDSFVVGAAISAVGSRMFHQSA